MNILIKKLTIENYLSFNTSQVIDFAKDHISCFVGHNGSGKTNLLEAIATLSDCYLNPDEEKRMIGTSFDQQTKPTILSVEFLVNQDKYCYTIESLPTNNKIIKEELCNGENELVLDLELRSCVGKFSDIERDRLRTYSISEIGIFHILSSRKVKIQDSSINEAVNNAKLFFQSIIYLLDSENLHNFKKHVNPPIFQGFSASPE